MLPGPQTPGLLPRYLGAQCLHLSPWGVLVRSSVLLARVRPFPVTPRATHGCALFCQEPDIHLESWDSLYPKLEFSPHPRQAPEEQFQTSWHTAPLLTTHAAPRQRPAPPTPQPLRLLPAPRMHLSIHLLANPILPVNLPAAIHSQGQTCPVLCSQLVGSCNCQHWIDWSGSFTIATIPVWSLHRQPRRPCPLQAGLKHRVSSPTLEPGSSFERSLGNSDAR